MVSAGNEACFFWVPTLEVCGSSTNFANADWIADPASCHRSTNPIFVCGRRLMCRGFRKHHFAEPDDVFDYLSRRPFLARGRTIPGTFTERDATALSTDLPW